MNQKRKDMKTDVFSGEYPEAWETLRNTLTDHVVQEISPLSKGTTNTSFLVKTQDKNYVLRVPGKTVGSYLDRKHEKEIYALLSQYEISDRVLYLDEESGYKLSEYCEGSRHMNPASESDMRLFLETAKKLHAMKLHCEAEYDFFEQIEKYESRSKTPFWFENYMAVREAIFSLRRFYDTVKKNYVLIHNDLSPENCLFVSDGSGGEKCILIDFEYAAMQMPVADIASYCVFSNLSEEETNHIIRLYYGNEIETIDWAYAYAYIALNALLHSNWLGVLSNDEKRKEEALCALHMAEHYLAKMQEIWEESACQE